VRNVKKVFGTDAQRYVALDGIDLQVSEGEFVCLLGPSGCGKSTLLNILAGFDQPSEGAVEFEGAPVRGAGKDRVMFFQDAGSALLPWLSAEENVRFALRVRKLPREEWPAIIDKYLVMVDLKDHRHKFPAQLSGGMRQRLQIARALAVEPKVLLMDEPFAALDALTRRRMHGFLLDIWKTTPFVALLLLAGLQSIPASVYEAARVDGASSWMTFWKVKLPLIRTSILIALLFRTLDAFRVFDSIYVLTQGGPANATETLSIYTYKTMMRSGDFGYGSTLAVATFLCIALISVVYLGIFRAGVGGRS